jgi:hypothetical protein
MDKIMCTVAESSFAMPPLGLLQVGNRNNEIENNVKENLIK